VSQYSLTPLARDSEDPTTGNKDNRIDEIRSIVQKQQSTSSKRLDPPYILQKSAPIPPISPGEDGRKDITTIPLVRT
jgi:hypothetical protein